MTYLAVGSFLPPAHGGLSTEDWIVSVIAITAFAVLAIAGLILGNRQAEPRRTAAQPPIDYRKAA